MSIVEDFRAKADEAERSAALMSRRDDRAALLEQARYWRALAAEAEAPEPPDPS